MIDPPRSGINKNGRWTKHQWSLDLDLYPDSPFVIVGFYNWHKDLHVIMTAHSSLRIGEFKNDQLVGSRNPDANILFDIRPNDQIIKSSNFGKKAFWNAFDISRHTLDNSYVHILEKPFIIHGLENVKIKGKLT